MVLDVRAQILCNLGPVISGSVKDDHVQGQGLVTTTGELVIAGLITPAHGDVVRLGYITPNRTKVARFPRGPFYVTKAFADPLANQTQVSIADKLAFEKNKGGGVINSDLLDGLNGREPKLAKSINLAEAFYLITNRLGIQVQDAGIWELYKQTGKIESDDYIETLSDMLASVTRFGYLNAQNRLVTSSYKDLSKTGPVIGFSKVVDIDGNQGGLDFTESPTGLGSAQQIEGENESATQWLPSDPSIQRAFYGSFATTWDSSQTSTETEITINLKDGTTRTYPITETVTSSEVKAEPDNRIVKRETVTETALVKLNSQVIQDFISAQITDRKPIETQPIPSRKIDTYTYEELPPPPLTEQEQQQLEQEIESARQAILANKPTTSHPVMSPSGVITLLPKLPTYRPVREEVAETMSAAEALGRIGIKDYTYYESIPVIEGFKQVVVTEILYAGSKEKRIERTYVAYGLTQMGQQSLSAAAAQAKRPQGEYLSFEPYLRAFFELVLEDSRIVTSDLPSDANEQVIPSYLAPFRYSDAVIQGTSQIQVGPTVGDRSNNSSPFRVPFLPDDVVNDDGTVTQGNAKTAAANYAEEQNRLLLGHRLGLQVTTALGVLPTKPLAAFHLRKGGITATYRTNGTVWTFDAGSCLVSTDALYWGLAGGEVNGPRWTPVAPGTTALPIPPADVDNGPQDPVNSATIITPVDETDSAAVETLLDSLPDDEAETFELELTPVALALPYKPITETALQVRLELEQLLVPLGINRSMGDATGQVVLQVKAQQELAEQVVLQLESAERQLLAETFSAGLGLGGNLS